MEERILKQVQDDGGKPDAADPRLGQPAPARAARAPGRDPGRGRPGRDRRDSGARPRSPIVTPAGWPPRRPPPWRSRAASSSRPTRWSRRAGGSFPRRESEGEARAALALLSGRRHRVHSAVAVTDSGRPHPDPALDQPRRLQAALVRGDRGLSRRRRVARQGGRLCHPGPGRGPGADAVGQPFGRDGPAALRDPDPAPSRRLSPWLSGSTKRG